MQYWFHCRALNIITVHAGTTAEKLYSVYELQSAKEVAVDEWMYQICNDSDADDPLVHWKRCWAALGDKTAATARVVSRYADAVQHLRQFMEEHPADPVARWLLRAIKARWAAPTEFCTGSTTWGKLRVLVHYSAPCSVLGSPEAMKSTTSPHRKGDMRLFRVLSDNIQMLLAAGSDAVC